MQVVDCLPFMTKNFLCRVVDSFVKAGVPKGDEDRLRQQILQNITELSSQERIATALSLDELREVTESS